MAQIIPYGQDSTGNTKFLQSSDTIRARTAVYRRYYHMPLFASNPGATGPTFTAPSANTTGGYRLDAATEFLYLEADIHSDWDGASDLKVEVFFQVNVDNTGGAVGDTVDLKLVGYFMGTGDTASKVPTIAEVATVVGKSAQYKLFKAEFTVDYDTVANVVEAGDKCGFILNLETDTSEVDDIIVTNASMYYNTTHIGIESGDV